jgi:hypothetical protein
MPKGKDGRPKITCRELTLRAWFLKLDIKIQESIFEQFSRQREPSENYDEYYESLE